MSKKSTAIGYIRTATENQNVGLNSIESQEKQIKEYCKKNNINLTSLFIDSGQSGSTLDHPAMTQMLKLIKSNKILQIIYLSLDRISRNTLKYIRFKNVLKKHNIKLRVISGPNSDAFPQFINDVLETINSLDSQIKRKRRKGK